MTKRKSTPNPTVLPGFPKIPADASPALRAYLSAISEALEVRLGRRGDIRDAAVTYRDLVDAGLASINTLGNNSNTGGATLTPNDPYLPPNTGDNPSTPVAPQGFQVNGAFSRIICQWANPYDLYYGHSITEIWRHTSDVLGDAEFIGSSPGMIYVDEVGEGESYYYWARHVNSLNVPGPWNSNSGTFGETADDVVFLLDVLSDAITYDEFAQSLKDEIDLISVIENTLYGGNLANPPQGSVMYDVRQNYNAILAAQADISAAQADIVVAENDIVNLQSVTATQTSQLNTLNTTVAGNSSSISSLQTTTANNATSITNLTTTVNGNSSSITNLQTTTGANATAITQLQTDVGNNSSLITTLQSTSATNATDITALETTVYDPSAGVSANANAISGLNTSVTNINGTLTAHGSDITTLNNTVFHPTTGLYATSVALNGLTNTVTSNANDINANQVNITSNANAISALQTTISDPNTGNSALSTAINNLSSTVTQNGNDISATASDVTTLSSTVNGHTVSISQQAVTNAALQGDITALEAEYSVKLDVNGNVSGYGLASGGSPQYSRFYVNADKFAIVPPGSSGSSAGIVPFVVVTSPITQNGVTVPAGTYIDTARIANGSIDNARIGNLAVDTQQIQDLAVQEAKIDNLAVTNAKIQNATIQGAKIANATITGAKIGNAQIDTLQVAGEAVVVPRSAQGSGGAIYGSWTQVGSLTINWGFNSNDIPSQVVLIGSLNQLAQSSGSTGITRRMRIQADTGNVNFGIVGSAESGVSTQQGWSNDHAASCLHTGRTGSVTYRILASTTGASTNAGSWSLTVFGAKR